MGFQRGFAMPHPETFRFTDLGATVHCGPVADELFDELPGLYSNALTTRGWFEAFDRIVPIGACVLDDPRHVLLFVMRGDAVEIINKAIAIAPREAWRVCNALFRALPGARRIEIEVLFSPEELYVPFRTLVSEEAYVIELPATVEEYTASLGSRTRKNLRNYKNRLERTYLDARTEVVAPSPQEAEELIARFVAWSTARMRARGVVSSFERDSARCERVLDAFIACDTEACITTIEERLAAVEFIFYAGDEAMIFAGCFDEQYADVHLGFLSTYRAVCHAIRRGARTCNLLWATSEYKLRLGARPLMMNRISVLRCPSARFWPPKECCKAIYQQLQRLLRLLLRKKRSSLIGERCRRFRKYWRQRLQ